jgi:FAD/FMN-containing dehydrogenase
MHKQKFLPREHGESGMRVLRALKSAFDPRGILNPGKVGM